MSGSTLHLAELQPMLLAASRVPWADPAFCAEIKADGYRLMAEIEGPRVELRTRNGANASTWYPEIRSTLAGLTKTRTVLDGEACVFDTIGRSDFEKLHARSRRRGWYAGADPVAFYVFDMLVHRGKDIRPLPLQDRKALLARLLARPRPGLLLCQYLPGDQAPDLYRMAVELKLEGIVMKRLASPYTGGEPRTGDWIKVKRPNATPAARFTRDTALIP